MAPQICKRGLYHHLVYLSSASRSPHSKPNAALLPIEVKKAGQHARCPESFDSAQDRPAEGLSFVQAPLLGYNQATVVAGVEVNEEELDGKQKEKETWPE